MFDDGVSSSSSPPQADNDAATSKVAASMRAMRLGGMGDHWGERKNFHAAVSGKTPASLGMGRDSPVNPRAAQRAVMYRPISIAMRVAVSVKRATTAGRLSAAPQKPLLGNHAAPLLAFRFIRQHKA